MASAVEAGRLRHGGSSVQLFLTKGGLNRCFFSFGAVAVAAGAGAAGVTGFGMLARGNGVTTGLGGDAGSTAVGAAGEVTGFMERILFFDFDAARHGPAGDIACDVPFVRMAR